MNYNTRSYRFYLILTLCAEVYMPQISGTVTGLSMMGALCRFWGTGYRSAAMVAPLASSGPSRCEAVLHG